MGLRHLYTEHVILKAPLIYGCQRNVLLNRNVIMLFPKDKETFLVFYIEIIKKYAYEYTGFFIFFFSYTGM